MPPFLRYPRHAPLPIRLQPSKFSHRTLSALNKTPRAPFAQIKTTSTTKTTTTSTTAKPTSPPTPQTPQHVHPPLQRPFFRTSLYFLFTFAAGCAAYDFIHTHLFTISTVTGASMYPFINTDYDRTLSLDRLILNCWNPASNLHRGEIIAFWTPHNPEKMAVKRVVALEGDGVITKNTYPVPMEEVPVGHVWVEGDGGEEGRSYDSNYYGPVSKALVVGKVVGVVWPLGRAGWVRWEDWRGSERVVEGKGAVEKIEFY